VRKQLQYETGGGKAARILRFTCEHRAKILLGSRIIISREPAIMLLMFKQLRSSVFHKFVLALFNLYSA